MLQTKLIPFLSMLLVQILILFLLVQPIKATSAVMLTDEDLIVSSRAIIYGKVISIESQYDENQENISTYIKIKVKQVFKGKLFEKEIVIRQMGGTVGDITQKVIGTPEFKLNEEVLLYLNTADDGALRVAHVFMGKFSVIKDKDKTYVLRQVGSATIIEPQGRSKEQTITNKMEFAAYVDKIKSVLSSKIERVNEYELINRDRPLLAIPKEYKPNISNGVIQPQFTFAGGPSRWQQADNGTPIRYNINTANAPVSGGGVAELDGSLAAWTNVSGASIILQRANNTSSCGFTNSDSTNTVSFGDCRNEVDDLVNCAGTLAVARFSFSNSVTKVINGTTFNQLIDADIVFNSFGSCSVSSSFIAEIMVHEVGHTIGLGHSSEDDGEPSQVLKDATMFFLIHNDGRGASLRSDDIAGVSFIYPAAGGNPTSSVTLNVTKVSATVNPGQSSVYPVAINRTNFTGPVQLGLTILANDVPPGISFSYSANPVTGTSSNLTIGTTTATPAGTYTFVVTGTASGITIANSNQFTLIVSQSTPNRDFSISVAPTSQTIAAGQTANYSLNATFTGGFSDPISFSFSSLPPGANVPQFQGNFPIPFQVVTSSTTPAGTYTFTVTGTGGGLTRTTTAVLIVQSAASVSLRVERNSATVTAGQTASYPVTISRTNFSSAVQLGLAILANDVPAGITFSYSNNPTTSSNVTLNLSTTMATPPGTYNFVATATANGVTIPNSNQFSLVVTAATQPDFAIAISPTSRTISPGQLADYTINATFMGGFSSSISFTFSNLPPGANVPQFQGNFPLPFQIATSSTTPPGTYNFTVTGTGGGLTRTSTATLIVQAPSSVSIRVERDSATVTSGQAASYPVTLTRNNFNGNVELGLSILASNVPPGVTFSYSSNPTTSSNVTLNISTTSATPPGTYNFVATAIANGITIPNSNQFSLVVMSAAQPDFSISISPSSRTVMAGQVADYTINGVFTGGFSSAISFAFSNLPPGANVPQFQGNFPLPFQVVTSSSTPAGTYSFTITGTGGGLTRTATATLIVQTPSGPMIDNASYRKPILTISGALFVGNVQVRVNGVDVTSRIIDLSDSLITLKGNKKKLRLQKGTNVVQVISNGIASNNFTFNFVADENLINLEQANSNIFGSGRSEDYYPNVFGEGSSN